VGLAVCSNALHLRGEPEVSGEDEDRHFLMWAELDAAYFHLYGMDRDDVDYIMETFPIVKRKDIAAHGTYRTKDKILEIYDAMARPSPPTRSTRPP
jgi:hypothetical protein